jgi:hypothetical protein
MASVKRPLYEGAKISQLDAIAQILANKAKNFLALYAGWLALIARGLAGALAPIARVGRR